MGLPIELPPDEVIKELEEQLESSFNHFIVSLDGVLEGIFTHQLTGSEIAVSFESKRIITGSPITELKTFMGEMDSVSLESMRDILESMLDNIEVLLSDSMTIEFDNQIPEFDGEWFNP